MSKSDYYVPKGGLPSQSELMTSRAVFTDAYAVIPRGSMTDIVTSRLPHWDKTRAWVIARPLSGFAESFSHYIVEVEPQGGSNAPEPEDGVQGVLFAVEGSASITIDGVTHRLEKGGCAYVAAGAVWALKNEGSSKAVFHWIRKRYQRVEGIDRPISFVRTETDGETVSMPDTDGAWATTRFVDPDDMSHDMHVNIVTIQPGAVIPFMETHVMEHGLYILEGKGVYRLNQDWVEVEAGDYLWLRAFCPQACYAGGPKPFRYLLYKDVNRHMPL